MPQARRGGLFACLRDAQPNHVHLILVPDREERSFARLARGAPPLFVDSQRAAQG
jgi:hypothetical protein